MRFTAFAIAAYGCESRAMTSGDKKCVVTFELRCCRRLLRVSWVERKTANFVLDKIGSVLILRKGMAEEDEVIWPHRPKKTALEKD